MPSHSFYITANGPVAVNPKNFAANGPNPGLEVSLGGHVESGSSSTAVATHTHYHPPPPSIPQQTRPTIEATAHHSSYHGGLPPPPTTVQQISASASMHGGPGMPGAWSTTSSVAGQNGWSSSATTTSYKGGTSVNATVTIHAPPPPPTPILVEFYGALPPTLQANPDAIPMLHLPHAVFPQCLKKPIHWNVNGYILRFPGGIDIGLHTYNHEETHFFPTGMGRMETLIIPQNWKIDIVRVQGTEKEMVMRIYKD